MMFFNNRNKIYDLTCAITSSCSLLLDARDNDVVSKKTYPGVTLGNTKRKAVNKKQGKYRPKHRPRGTPLSTVAVDSAHLLYFGSLPIPIRTQGHTPLVIEFNIVAYSIPTLDNLQHHLEYPFQTHKTKKKVS